MLYVDGLVGLIFMGVWIFCIIDVIMTPEGSCRNLPKLVWLLVVILVPDIGSLVWLIAGRPRRARQPWSGNDAGARTSAFPEYERPGRATASTPEADAAFLRQCRERAEAQRQDFRRRTADTEDS